MFLQHKYMFSVNLALFGLPFPNSFWWIASLVPADLINRKTANTSNFDFLWLSSFFVVFVFSILGRLWSPVRVCVSYGFPPKKNAGTSWILRFGVFINPMYRQISSEILKVCARWPGIRIIVDLGRRLKTWFPCPCWIRISASVKGLKTL